MASRYSGEKKNWSQSMEEIHGHNYEQMIWSTETKASFRVIWQKFITDSIRVITCVKIKVQLAAHSKYYCTTGEAYEFMIVTFCSLRGFRLSSKTTFRWDMFRLFPYIKPIFFKKPINTRYEISARFGWSYLAVTEVTTEKNSKYSKSSSAWGIKLLK